MNHKEIEVLADDECADLYRIYEKSLQLVEVFQFEETKTCRAEFVLPTEICLMIPKSYRLLSNKAKTTFVFVLFELP